MRRWLAMIAGIAAVVVTGAALGLTGSNPPDATTTTVDWSKVTSTTLKADVAAPKQTTTTTTTTKPEKPASSNATDTTPPALTILHPVDGQVLKEKKVVFEGTTEPGARVFAGNYEAEVTDDGAWRIELILSPGGNHATIKAKDSAGNVASASVSVRYDAPVEDKEEPKKDESKDEGESKDEEVDWVFKAFQVFGECAENPPYDVFHGKGKPGGVIMVKSEFGNGSTEIEENGEWELKVFFPDAPVGKAFPVKVKDEFGNFQVFEFTRTG